MNITDWNLISEEEQQNCLERPAITNAQSIAKSVAEIIQTIRSEGDDGIKALTAKFDKYDLDALAVSTTEKQAAFARISDDFKQAIAVAVSNLTRFHKAQRKAPVEVETLAGVKCQQVTRPVESVGLYIPGGTAPLLSTVMMLAIPAKIAGCRTRILCSPPPIADEILYAAEVCGIDAIYQVGGAQAIAAMAFGTATIPKVDKIFGPGNAYVTEAKAQVSRVSQGAAIDMPAGPSEVLVIADAQANPTFVAADLLSQAEHGKDSQVILVTPCRTLANAVIDEVAKQLAELPRKEIAEVSLSFSRIILTRDLAQCVAISNRYAPEHLIIQTADPEALVPNIAHAGSVFLGAWSPESVGDYASGTNHVLPTYGYAKTYSSLGLADFQKRMTIQTLSEKGLLALAPTVELLAEREQLTAHKRAVSLRVQALKERNS